MTFDASNYSFFDLGGDDGGLGESLEGALEVRIELLQM